LVALKAGEQQAPVSFKEMIGYKETTSGTTVSWTCMTFTGTVLLYCLPGDNSSPARGKIRIHF